MIAKVPSRFLIRNPVNPQRRTPLLPAKQSRAVVLWMCSFYAQFEQVSDLQRNVQGVRFCTVNEASSSGLPLRNKHSPSQPPPPALCPACFRMIEED